MEILKELLKGNRRAAAKLISLVEDDFTQAEIFLKQIYPYTGQAIVIGITGPPGVGKSTITDRLTKNLRKQGTKVGIIAIDPTSPFTGGALLGDRIRMQDLSADPEVFIRSMGTRGFLGGLSKATQATIKILDAMGKEVIFVETVGVGQAEVDIVKVADMVVLITMPGMGDDIQIIKAGIMEIGDIFVVNKADRDGCERLITEIEMMLALKTEIKWKPPVLKTIATSGTGIIDVEETIFRYISYLKESGELEKKRKESTRKEIIDLLREKWGILFNKYIKKDFLEEVITRVIQRKEDPYTVVNRLSDILINSYKQGEKDYDQ
ncbi:MAG: methylmalonyl Co-A mutase-associated GTPase MeaB [Candidatus Caldatribacteriota bacterium]